MSKAAEAFLLNVIVATAEQDVKSLAQALEEERDFEQVVACVVQASRACFTAVLEAILEHPREEIEHNTTCPQCGQRMRNKGEQERGIVTPLGNVRWRRRYYYCSACRQGHYPLDEHWNIVAEQFTDDCQAMMTLLGAFCSYEHAAQVFERLTGIGVSGREIGRTIIERGIALERVRLEEQTRWLEQGPPVEKSTSAQPCECSLDAAKVRFRDGWHDVKAGIVHPLQGDLPQSYIVEVGSMEQAGRKLYAEVIRQGSNPDRDTMVCVADGAPTNWIQFEANFTQRVEILDWYHATEHLWAAANGVYGEGTAEAKAWEKEAESVLWTGHPEQVLELLTQAEQHPKGQAAASQQHYFETNQARMQYQAYREQAYPIGSGRMESGCKQAIVARARQAGMSWSQQGLQSVLALRAEFLNQRFDAAWALTRSRAA